MTVTLSGGEPLMHPQVKSILDRLLDADLLVNVTTNGVLLDRLPDDLLDRLNWLRVSFHHPQERFNRAIMGQRYDHRRALENILKRSQRGKRFSLFALLTSELIATKGYLELLAFARDAGILQVQFGLIKLLGLADSRQLPNIQEVNAALDNLKQHADQFGVAIAFPDRLSDIPEKHLCYARSRNMALKPNGDVSGCSFEDASMWGNIHKESLGEIWNRRLDGAHYCDLCRSGGYFKDTRN